MGKVAKRIAKFRVAFGVQCNRCGSVRYAIANDLESDQIQGGMQSALDMWRDYGEPNHHCEVKRKKLKE